MITLVMLIIVGSAITVSFVYFDPLGMGILDNEQTPQAIEIQETNPINPNMAGTSDKVTLKLERSDNVTQTINSENWYFIESVGGWYADIKDDSYKPRPVLGFGEEILYFECYTPYNKPPEYFGTFQNQGEPFLMVEVYINGQLTEVRSTERNRSLTLEGNC